MSDSHVAFGVMTRTGTATVIALSGTPNRPQFAGRRELVLTPPSLPRQPYHAAAELDVAAAEALVDRVQAAAETAAATGLRELAAERPATAVLGVAVVVKAVRVPSQVSQVLRSHAWIHAAEGVLYRDAVLAAADRCGWRPVAIDGRTLDVPAAALEGLAAAAGRPWRKQEKQAAASALTLLPGD